eukprot:5244558-Amphidinium_carterae.1
MNRDGEEVISYEFINGCSTWVLLLGFVPPEPFANHYQKYKHSLRSPEILCIVVFCFSITSLDQRRTP